MYTHSKRDFCAPLAVAPLRKAVAVTPGSAMQRGGWQRAWEGVGETSETQPYLILIRLSRPRIAVLRLAARSRCVLGPSPQPR